MKRKPLPHRFQVEAKALGDPTRHRIFRYVADAARPVGVAELTEHVGLNHNSVRQHLAVLKEAGLVVEDVEARDRPGRPRLLYRLHPEAAGTWGTSGPYEFLARLLGEALRDGTSPRDAGRLAGRREVPDDDGHGDAVETIDAEMTRRGFRPTRTARGGRVEFVLGRCPFEDVAVSNPDTVCQVHLGLAEGMAERLERIEVLRLDAKDPRRAGCRLSMRRTTDPTLPRG